MRQTDRDDELSGTQISVIKTIVNATTTAVSQYRQWVAADLLLRVLDLEKCGREASATHRNLCNKVYVGLQSLCKGALPTRRGRIFVRSRVVDQRHRPSSNFGGLLLQRMLRPRILLEGSTAQKASTHQPLQFSILVQITMPS